MDISQKDLLFEVIKTRLEPLGFTVSNKEEGWFGRPRKWSPIPEVRYLDDMPEYTTKIAPAMENLWQEMVEEGCDLILSSSRFGSTLRVITKDYQTFSFSGMEIPTIISRAYVRWKNKF